MRIPQPIRTRCRLCIPGLVLAFLATPAWGALKIRITHGVRTATPIAVVPFAWQVGGRPPFQPATIIAHDLVRTGLFRTLSRRDLVQQPTRPAQINFLNWKALGMSYLVIGRVVQDHPGGGLATGLPPVQRSGGPSGFGICHSHQPAAAPPYRP